MTTHIIVIGPGLVMWLDELLVQAEGSQPIESGSAGTLHVHMLGGGVLELQITVVMVTIVWWRRRL